MWHNSRAVLCSRARRANAMLRAHCPQIGGFPSISNRCLTVETARELLGIPKQRAVTTCDLREAYFDAAKRCHPDSTARVTMTSPNMIDAAQTFHLVTEAYELLQKGASDDLAISLAEETQYRNACRQWLGIDAEVVEESKQCPAFRQWLQGKTDAAFHWRLFFMKHGGLATKLRPPTALLGEHPPRSDTVKSATRRRRPSLRSR